MGEMVREGQYGKARKHDLSESTGENELFLYGKLNTKDTPICPDFILCFLGVWGSLIQGSGTE